MSKAEKRESGIMEYWNDGIMEYRKKDQERRGIMGKIQTKQKKFTQYSSIPTFHLSILRCHLFGV